MALIKTLRVDDDVLEILKNQVIWADEGNGDWIAYMPQLDPALYRKVKQVFQHPQLDGTWVRSRNGTVFPRDPRPMLYQVAETGKMSLPRDGFFRTPPEVTRKLLGFMAVGVTGDYKWLEPSCGDGAIIRILREDGVCAAESIWAVEQNPERAKFVQETFPGVWVTCEDFIHYAQAVRVPFFDYIIMNPPFEKGQDADHVRRAYNLLKKGGTLGAILSESPFFRDDDKSQTFRAWMKAVGAYAERLPDGSFKSSGTGVATRWLVVEKE